ncbi:hypothetical protein [Natronosalvus vescus]|uniref:hypothetical protein n=1 Tax=Natronosalvus vescus TaxID=2953881 RepID=UPI0020905FE4|nr:hypothetical protein [Natronosalvus vescus]
MVTGSDRGAPADSHSAVSDAVTLHVRCYPETGGLQTLTGWPSAHREAVTGVSDAMRTLASEIETRTSFDRVYWRVEPMTPVDLSTGPGLEDGTDHTDTEDVDPVTAMTDRFYRHLEHRETLTGTGCHLLLAWRPFDSNLGYGTTPSAYRRVGRRAGDAVTVANIGATEMWDTRAVTVNIAIHEVLHTFLSPAAARTVVGVGCDHSLGTVRELEDGVREVSPMATAYAGAGTEGTDNDTRFSGTGCGHHADFYRHDGVEGVHTWEHTTKMSEGTLEAASQYVEDTFGE